MCPNQMQISKMSSSRMEKALNGVTLPLVNMKRHIQLERSSMSLGMWSLAAEAVVAKVVDIMVG